jgi:hypothetical protein
MLTHRYPCTVVPSSESHLPCTINDEIRRQCRRALSNRTLPRIQFLPRTRAWLTPRGKQYLCAHPRQSRTSKSQLGKSLIKCGEFADRHLGEHAIRSARRGGSRPAGASPRESRTGWRGGAIARRGGASGGRSVGGRGRGSGGVTGTGKGGERTYKLEKLFLERGEEWW